MGRSAFMLGLTEGSLPGPLAYAGTQHGLRPYVLEEYFERWAPRDALISAPARLAYAQHGWVTIAGVYPRLEPERRRYVDKDVDREIELFTWERANRVEDLRLAVQRSKHYASKRVNA